MRRTVNILILLLLIIILLVLTNPDKNQFVDWARQQAEDQADSKIEKLLGDVLGRPLLSISTKKKDYLLFSVFTIEKAGDQGVFLGFLRYIFLEIK